MGLTHLVGLCGDPSNFGDLLSFTFELRRRFKLAAVLPYPFLSPLRLVNLFLDQFLLALQNRVQRWVR